MSAALELKSISKFFGTHRILNGIDLQVDAGTITSIIGASGSGKTTLLRIIAGFETPDYGSVLLDGLVIEQAEVSALKRGDRKDQGRLETVHIAPEKRSIGYMAQEGALFPHLEVGDNVAFGLHRTQRKDPSRVHEVLELVGLNPTYCSRRPQELSGGEQRRVALARALAPRPSAIVLDEPFSGLDTGLRSDTREAIRLALLEEGTTAILVTHDQGEALSMGGQVAVLMDGTFPQIGSPEQVYRRPISIDVAKFLGDAILVPGICKGALIVTEMGTIAIAGKSVGVPGEEAVAMLRPEQILICDKESPQRNGSALVTAVKYYGSDAMVALSLFPDGQSESRKDALSAEDAAESRFEFSSRMWGSGLPQVGDQVGFIVQGEAVVYPPNPTSPFTAQGAEG